MCWFRPAFAVALDCAATRAGDSAPGQTVRVGRIGSPSCCNAARNAAMQTLSHQELRDHAGRAGPALACAVGTSGCARVGVAVGAIGPGRGRAPGTTDPLAEMAAMHPDSAS